MPLAWSRIALLCSLLLCVSGCGGSEPTSGPGPVPQPAPAAPITINRTIVDGRVVDEDTRLPIAGVRVEAISDSTTVSLTTTADGGFRMELPAGVARFQLTREGYASRSAEYAIDAAAFSIEIALTKVVLPPPPTPYTYTLTGLVVDSRGSPVAQADVVGYRNDSPVDDAVGRATTDAAGRFTLTSTRMPQDVQVYKRGYQQTKARVGTFGADGTAAITIAVPRFVRYTLLPPPAISVGQIVQIQARIDLDNDASISTIAGDLISSDPAIVSPISLGWVKGVGVGAATVTGTYEGLSGTTMVQVTR